MAQTGGPKVSRDVSRDQIAQRDAHRRCQARSRLWQRTRYRARSRTPRLFQLRKRSAVVAHALEMPGTRRVADPAAGEEGAEPSVIGRGLERATEAHDVPDRNPRVGWQC